MTRAIASLLSGTHTAKRVIIVQEPSKTQVEKIESKQKGIILKYSH